MVVKFCLKSVEIRSKFVPLCPVNVSTTASLSTAHNDFNIVILFYVICLLMI